MGDKVRGNGEEVQGKPGRVGEVCCGTQQYLKLWIAFCLKLYYININLTICKSSGQLEELETFANHLSHQS